jgi:transcriptional regulator with XRE-family HTH domain
MAEGAAGPGSSTSGDVAATGGLGGKVDFLFRTVHPRGRGEYTYKEVELALRERGHRVSDSSLHQLRTGKAANPTFRTLQALSDFFGVPAEYLFDDEVSARVEQELELLAHLRDQRIRSIATRAAGLSEANLALLSDVIDSMRTLSAADRSGAEQPGAEQPGAEQPGAGQPGAEPGIA